MKKVLSLFVFIATIAIMSVFAVNAYAQEIVEINNDNTAVTLSTSSYIYNGIEKKPSVKIVYTDEEGEQTTLSAKTDYTVSYENNVNSGTATVNIEGIGDYSGIVTTTFKINRYSITNQKNIKTALSYTTTTFTGKAKTPKPTINFTSSQGTTTLQNNIDYKVSYTNNINPGKATVKITGIGNFTGSYTKTYIIKPKNVTGVKTSDRTTSSIILKWTKQDNISGYEIVVYDSSKKAYKHLAFVSSKSTSYKLTKQKSGSVKKYKIRAYKTINDKKHYGKYSNVINAVISPTKISLISVAKSSSKLSVEWKKVNCSGYEIEYTTDKSFKKNVKSVKVNGASKTSYTIKNVDKSKTYYVKVRAFVKSNDKYYYGKRSSSLSSYYSNLYATYSSNYVNNANRTTNLRIASKAISGTIVGVGKTFSFNNVVGPRTTAKGYKSAHVFAGTQVVEGIGGGICQVASTMFNCALKANVTITERHQHSQRVAYVPLGRDAAIYGNTQDFKWTNNTKYPIKIVMSVKDGVIKCSFYTCEKAKPSAVSLNVTQSGNSFTLKRTVKGKVNYSCRSTY